MHACGVTVDTVVLQFCTQVNSSRKDSQGSDHAPTIQINDIELNMKSAPINGTLHNSVGDHYNSSSTLVAMEGHSPVGSRSSTPVAHKTNSGDPGDSGYGMEDVGSDSVEHHKVSHMSPSYDNELSARLSVASDSDYSVSSRSNLSDIDDTTEIGYFKHMADLNSNNSLAVRIKVMICLFLPTCNASSKIYLIRTYNHVASHTNMWFNFFLGSNFIFLC